MKDGEWGGDLTLHTIAVLANVDIVIINGIAKTDTVKYLCTANGNFSSQYVSWCREVVPLLEQCMAYVAGARKLCALVHQDLSDFDCLCDISTPYALLRRV
eukprot:481550-Pleurochrysis_carterae.AAC.1